MQYNPKDILMNQYEATGHQPPHQQLQSGVCANIGLKSIDSSCSPILTIAVAGTPSIFRYSQVPSGSTVPRSGRSPRTWTRSPGTTVGSVPAARRGHSSSAKKRRAWMRSIRADHKWKISRAAMGFTNSTEKWKKYIYICPSLQCWSLTLHLSNTMFDLVKLCIS